LVRANLTEADVRRIVEETLVSRKVIPELVIPDECLNY